MTQTPKIHNSVVILGGSVCTEYGLNVTKCFSEHLAKAGVNIVSGLETDISFLSLKCALNVGGYASGFLANSLKFSRKIEKVNVATKKLLSNKKGRLYVVSKDYSKTRNAFITRDRYMIKSCDCVLVIEALVESRIFQAVEYAVSINKPVFVIPGNIFSYTSKGCSFLIKTGAKLVDSYKDITDFLNI